MILDRDSCGRIVFHLLRRHGHHHVENVFGVHHQIVLVDQLHLRFGQLQLHQHHRHPNLHDKEASSTFCLKVITNLLDVVVWGVGHHDHGLVLRRDHHDQIVVQLSSRHQQLVLGLPSLVGPSFLLPRLLYDRVFTLKYHYLWFWCVLCIFSLLIESFEFFKWIDVFCILVFDIIVFNSETIDDVDRVFILNSWHH